MLKLKEDMKRFFAYLNASDTFPDANARKFRDVYLASIAAHTASFLPEMPEWRLPSSGGENATLPPSGENQSGLFKGMEPEQVFFLLSCFDHCGYSGRERLSKVCAVTIVLCLRACYIPVHSFPKTGGRPVLCKSPPSGVSISAAADWM